MLKSDPLVTYVVSKNKHYICVDGVNFTQHYADVFPTGSTGKGCCMHARRAVGLFRDRYCPQGRIDEAELACSSGFRAREAGETSSRGLWLMRHVTQGILVHAAPLASRFECSAWFYDYM